MKITRRFTSPGQDVYRAVKWDKRTSRICNPDGSVVFEMNDAEVPSQWSQLATDIMVSKYFRKAGVPLSDENGQVLRDTSGNVVTGPERSARQVIHRLAGCWRHWGEKCGYFDSADDAQAFYDELAHMMVHQMCAPNSPQWFNTGLHFAYGITGPAQGHHYCDPKTGELLKSRDAYSHPQPHACQPFRAPVSTPSGPISIGKVVTENLIGLEVYDGTDEGMGTTRVTAVKTNGVKAVFRLVLDGGISVEATADHLVYTLTADGLTGRWVRLDSLERGARLLRTVRDHVAEKSLGIATGANGTDLQTLALQKLQEVVLRRIEPLGAMQVYDIQTESGQYLSNNIIIHNCFIQSCTDDLVNGGGIMDLWTREARLFKYGSGTGSNFSKLRGENEPLSGGGKSSGLMSFLKIGDRAAGAIKSGGTTRRAAKMVCLDLEHPDIEAFVNWKVREELKVACLAEGIKHIPAAERDLAKKLGLKLDYDFNGESYITVSGQNSNNSVRIPNRFFKAIEEDGDWTLTWRTNGKKAKTLKARDLWEQIAFAAWRCADPGVQYDDTINQWHTCPQSGRINASNPCVTGDTRVLTPGGIWRRIDQMIHLPARVVTNLHGHEIHVTDGAFPTGTREVYELRTAGGYCVKVTADHKVWTRTRGWVAAKDLTTDDQVKLTSKPACVSDIGEPQDSKFFQLLGLYVSDSNPRVDGLRLDACLASSDSDSVDDFAHYVEAFWGERLYADDYAIPSMLDSSAAMTVADAAAAASDTHTSTATLTNRRLISRLRAFLRPEAGQRRFGEEIFTAGLAAQRHLLRGLFTADAELQNDTLVITSENAGQLEDIQLLLTGFGVQTAVFEVISDGRTDTPAIFQDSYRTDLNIGEGGALATSGGGASACGVLPDRQATQGREPLAPLPVPGLRNGGGLASGLPRNDAVSRRHGLRIDPGSLRSFGKYVGLLPGRKLKQLAEAIGRNQEALAKSAEAEVGGRFASTQPNGVARSESSPGNWDRVASLTSIGQRQVFDLTEPVTGSFIANGLTVHNCSEYMFLDDTACNLASLNVLTFFDAESRRFDVEGYKHAIRIWTIVLEISVLMASFPSESIARLSYKFRTLGLGYANLGAMLMQAGIPYDSVKGRAICGALSAVLTGESYATSAEMARELGAFSGYLENKDDMLRVMRNHRRAAYNVAQNARGRDLAGSYERLDIHPVGIDESQFASDDPMTPRSLLTASRECWDRALHLGEQHGYRNAQTTVIAPTGTIGLLMDCDTTGVEPDFALVKFKKLAGGGYFKIANQSLQPALRNLGYEADEVHAILQYVMGTLTLHGSPHVSYDRLLDLGFTAAELEKIESVLPGTFEISFAFSPWSLGAEFFKRFRIDDATWQAPDFNLLRHLGFSRKQIDEANDVICGRGTVEGAPFLKDEHLPVFDCANKCGKVGKRFIQVEGHIRMMAAAQPFISGAISKTINLPNEATVEEIKNSYALSWKLGLKANALYRDGSKLSQPLNVKSDADVDAKTDGEDMESIEAARDEVAADVALAAASISALKPELPESVASSDNLAPLTPTHTHVIERIVERIVERPLRRRLPDTRRALTHKFDVAGHEGYITVGLYDDNQPGEVFIRIAKEGSTIGGLMDTIATLVSVSLQYGVPIESLVRKFEHVRFEPSGMTRNPEIPFAKSLVDYIFRYLAMEFVTGYRAQHSPKREPKKIASRPTEQEAHAPPTEAPVAEVRPPTKSGNGHSANRLDVAANLADAHSTHLQAPEVGPQSVNITANLRLAVSADPLSQQGSHLQADAPACDVCGSITVRSGTCYKCMNCGNSMGCS